MIAGSEQGPRQGERCGATSEACAGSAGGPAPSSSEATAYEAPPPLPAGPLHPGEVIRALARAARCFVTYDARNDAVRGFIVAYRDAARRALEDHGALTYQVAPFEITWQSEPVYRDEDRERSLAFRLFRDGVRSLTLRPDVPWEELLRLLEILSVRYTRIRLHEEDTLTLLRQAGLRSISFEVVEVYIPAEENPEGTFTPLAEQERLQPPPDWDQPLPRLGAPVALAFRPVPEEALRALREETSEPRTIEAAV